MAFKKDPTIILKYDPFHGLSCADGRVDYIVDSFYAIVHRDKYLKTNFGNLVVIKKFIEDAPKHGIILTVLHFSLSILKVKKKNSKSN